MKAIALFLISLILIHPYRCDKVLANFIREYYESFNIHHIIIFACWEYADDISRMVMGLDNAVVYQSTTTDLNFDSIFHVTEFQLGAVLDFDCPSSHKVLDQFSHQLQFNDSYHWLVLSESHHVPVDYFENLALTIETELTFAVRHTNTYKLYEIYNPSYRHNCNVITTIKGDWTPDAGLNDTLTEYKYVRRDFHQVTLNMTATFIVPVVTDVITYLSAPTHKATDTMPQSQYQVMLLLQYLYKFSYTVYKSPLWGVLVNGTYNGIVGDLVADDGLDISISPFEFHSIRSLSMEHLVPTWYMDFTFTFLHPKASTMRNNFLKPFTDDLWWAILVIGTIYWILLLISLILEQRYLSGQPNVNESAVETGLTTIAAISQQGLSDSPNFVSGRITFLSLFLWALLLYQFYSASIVSSLMITPPRWIKTVKNLTNSELEVGAIDLAYFREYFEITRNPDLIELYNRKMNRSVKKFPKAFLPIRAGWKQIQKGGYAYLSETAATYRAIRATFNEDQICALQEIKPQARVKQSMGIPIASPFQKMLTYGLTKIIQSGLLVRIQKEWRPAIPKCPENYNDTPTPMGMKQFAPALFLLGIGIGVSIAILIMEYLYCYVIDIPSVGVETADEFLECDE